MGWLMKLNPILIIDSHAIAHTVKYGLVHLTHNEQSVGIILGFLRKIYSLANRFETNKIVFTWDSKRRKRAKIYPAYKQSRVDNKSEEMKALDLLVYPQIDDLRFSVIPELGFKNSFMQSGLEADDLIAVIARMPTDEDKIIISGDHDLYQLLSPTVHLFSAAKKAKVYTAKHFVKEWGVEPNEWGMVKQIAGCTTDNVEGISRVGEKTAIKYLIGDLKHTTKAYQAIKDGEDIIKRNEVLVKLPFPSTKEVTLNWDEKFTILNFLRVTEKYGLNSMQTEKNIDNWSTLFNMR
jgi:DNA polymerase I